MALASEFHFTDVKEGRTFRDHQLSLDGPDLADLIARLERVVEPLEHDHADTVARDGAGRGPVERGLVAQSTEPEHPAPARPCFQPNGS